MMRVTRPGGEIRLGRVLRGSMYEPQKNLSIALTETLEELKKTFGVKIEQIHFMEDDTYEWEGDKQTDRLLAKTYLIKIHKPK
jgi:hypothetical protein